MAVPTKRVAILPQLLHHFKAHTLPRSTRFQHRPQHFAHTSAAWKTQAQHLLKESRERAAKLSRIHCTVHQIFLVLIGRLPIWPSATKRNHTD
jgi:hypothetical protein